MSTYNLFLDPKHHFFNNITFEGSSINHNGTVTTTLTKPNNLQY